MQPIYRKILLVDDEPVMQDLLRDIFSGDSAVFLSAGTLKEARALLKTHRPDVILLDRRLPDGDGVELCAEVRRDPRLSSVPILMITGCKEAGDTVLGLRTGADDYITKPFAVAEVKARVEALLRRADEAAMARKIRSDILRRPS